ncbi:hypothetical protein NE237_008619 [Protea cynaroides]|uniref:PGG domain-containing protein n=1 Tax=Protea cynaroides TaxID=273540 RepID=A0A9Q0KWE0_9MAGN|nr:hypothetical protein NE237_008619 [Protea cynaroides]
MEEHMETKFMASEEELQENNPISLDDVPLLTRESYTIWKDKMGKFLKNYGLWGYVDGTIHEHEDYSNYHQFWSVPDILRIKCEAMAQPYIEGLNSARHIWSQLVTMYEFIDPTNTGMKMMRTRYTWCLPFYTAIVIDGDWKIVSEFLSKNKGLLIAILTSEGEVPLHLAVEKRQFNLAKELINIMSAEDLSKQDKFDRTALHIAALDGNLKIVKAIVEKDEKLVTIQNKSSNMSTTPIMVAASARKSKVVSYLHPITLRQEANRKEVYPGEREKARANLLSSLIFNGLFGLAHDLVRKYPSLVFTEDDSGCTPIYILSTKTLAFPSAFKPRRSGIMKLEHYIWLVLYSFLDADFHARKACWHKRGDAENSIHTNGDNARNTCWHKRGDAENSFHTNGDNAKNACWHVRGDLENSVHTNGGSPQGNIMCELCRSTNCIIRFWKSLRLWFHTLCQNALTLVPGFKVIHFGKLMQYEACELLKEIWRQIPVLDQDLDQHDPKVVEKAMVKAIPVAIENGIVEFIEELINNWPQLLSHHPVFHLAISNRQEKIFRLIHRLGSFKYELARRPDGPDGNLFSHLAAKKAPDQKLDRLQGAALQMQSELLWYEEVERIMFRNHDSFMNKDGKTPRKLFTEEHKELLKEGATWMKDTATQCMVVATLITTIMFAAMFTVPGVGKEETDHGYIHGTFPIIFVTSNILALCSSVASMLMFLAIITSRYAEQDFLWILPKMLKMGYFFLFISIVGMMISFVAATLVMLPYDVVWISFPIVCMASIPITMYALAELPLFMQLKGY